MLCIKKKTARRTVFSNILVVLRLHLEVGLGVLADGAEFRRLLADHDMTAV